MLSSFVVLCSIPVKRSDAALNVHFHNHAYFVWGGFAVIFFIVSERRSHRPISFLHCAGFVLDYRKLCISKWSKLSKKAEALQ